MTGAGQGDGPGPRQVAVAATSSLARDAALQVVRDGGNAVDAAIVAAFCALATEPGIVSIMAGAYVNIWPVDGPPVVIDGNVEMPGRGLPPSAFGEGVIDVHLPYGGGVDMGAGAGSVANSGAIQALSLAAQRHGSAPFDRLVAPAAAACRDGYRVGAAAASYLAITHQILFGLDPQAHALVVDAAGQPLAPGAISTNPMLADALDELGRVGPSLMTTGEIGRSLVAMMRAQGGLITADDLAAYEVVVREPVLRQIGDWSVAINPPPSVGGPMLAVMLAELGARGYWHWPDVIEIQRRVLDYRRTVHDLSRDLDGDGHRLLLEVERYGLAGLPTSASTAHVSAVDSDGLACAITMSAGYGAGVTIPDTGMLLNNALGEPELNRLGRHAVAPGTRLASNMAPTTGRTADGRSLAIGSPGADRITTALMQVLGQGCLHGMDLRHAIDAHRLHVRFEPDGTPVVEFEDDTAIAEAVASLGLAGNRHPGQHMYFGGVGAAYHRPDGSLEAAGDARREAAVGIA